MSAAALTLLAWTTPGAQQPFPLSELTELHEPGLIGLIEMPWLYPSEPRQPIVVEAHDEPLPDSRVVALLDGQGVRTPEGRRLCQWTRDLDVQAGASPGCQFMEAGYEEPALPVFEARANGWYRIALSATGDLTGWVRNDNRFHSLPEMLAGSTHLTFLDARLFDGWLSDEPAGPGARIVTPAGTTPPRELPYEALGHAVVNGRLWLHVRILDRVCEPGDPVEVSRGWLAAKTSEGRPVAWFWSRGC